jgi:predicted O-methyltransferase YrrM
MADNVLRRGLVADFSDDNPRVATFKDDPEKLKMNEDSKFLRIPGTAGREIGLTSDSTVVKSIEEFNKELASNQRLEAVLLPLYDGLGLARLID